MTSRSNKSAGRGAEAEIERSREEGNWARAIELAQQLRARSPQHESLAQFLLGEGKLESCLEAAGAAGGADAGALAEARAHLMRATDEAGARAGVALDAHLLLAKLHHASGDVPAALEHYRLAELSSLTEKDLPLRSLRIVAESYAIRGLCLESGVVGAGSRYKQAERDADTARSFELAAELTLLYLQRAGGAGLAAGGQAPPALEAALQRAPLLHLRARRLPRALDLYRATLAAVEAPGTHAARLAVARHLAELLLRGVTHPLYRAPTPPPQPPRTPSPWKPKKYSAMNQFVPENEFEEVLLALGVGEATAVRDAVLSQSAEFEAARTHAHNNATNVLDLLALVAARWGQLASVLESLERAMKFSFGCGHVWRQRALAAAALPAPAGASGTAGAESAAHVRAVMVARRALAITPDDAALLLVACGTCYALGRLEEGIELAERALRLEAARAGPLHARAALLVGVGHASRAQSSPCPRERRARASDARTYLELAVQLDDNDHLAWYHLALTHTRAGRLNLGMEATRACLAARPESGGGLRLCAALWSCACAGGRGERALHAAALARSHYPRAQWPLAALAELRARREGPEAALAAGRDLLLALHDEPEPDAAVYCELDAPSECGEATSAASTASGARAGGAAAGRAAAWLALGALCARAGRPGAAAGCVSEALSLSGGRCAGVLHLRGLVHAARGQWGEARACFTDALAAAPRRVDSMVALGGAYYALGWLRLSEAALRAAAALEARRADTWRRLALVLSALGEPHAAADCAAAALALQPAQPALTLPN